MSKIPRRVQGGYYKPHVETIWPAPDCGEADLCAVPEHLLRSAWAAYVSLLTDPESVALSKLRSARGGWALLRLDEESP